MPLACALARLPAWLQITCYLPVEASFGIANEMRQRSSGAAQASLLLSHWERVPVRRHSVSDTRDLGACIAPTFIFRSIDLENVSLDHMYAGTSTLIEGLGREGKQAASDHVILV